MRWILLDVALALLALGLLALVGLRLWRKVTALGRALERATSTVAEATAQLERASSSPEPSSPGDPPPPVRQPSRRGSHRLSPGVRSGPSRRRPA